METINKNQFRFVQDECEKFNDYTGYTVSAEEVLHYHFTGDMLYDHNEGKDNDPFWNITEDCHSVEFFVKDVCKKLK